MQDNDDKARILIYAIIDRIGKESSAFHDLIKILKDKNGGPLSMAVASQLEEKLKAITQEEDLKAKSESLETNQEQKDSDNSSESSYHSARSSLTDSCGKFSW